MTTALTPLQEYKDKNIQYNTMEVNENSENKPLSQKTYTCTQLICIVCIIFFLLLSAFILAIFLIPRFKCNNFNESVIVNEEKFPWKGSDLPDIVYPVHYSLLFNPDLNNFRLYGDVNITFRVRNYIDFLLLNTKNLNFSKLELLNDKPKLESHIENNQTELIYIKFGCDFKPNTDYVLRIQFEKKSDEIASGVYMTSYEHKQGMKRYIVATYFDKKHARRGFPCFDEPKFKSTFQLSISHSFDYEPISNTDLKETVSNGNIVNSIFEETSPISASAVGFIISDFKFQRKDFNGISIRISTPSQYYSRCTFALQTSFDVLKYFNNKLNLTYPFSKLDISTLLNFEYPGSSSASLIFMKLSNILVEQQESYDEREVVVTSLAHQIAHQYFGNEISMKSWNDQWLMEGLASYLEHLASEEVLKEKLEFYINFLHPTYRLGKFASFKPLQEEIRKLSEITNIYSELEYHKGAAIFWMLDNFLGRETLLFTLSHLLDMYRFKSITFCNIWNIMDESNFTQTLNISAMMNSWIEQKGYPIITVIRHRNRLVVSQKPFLLEAKEKNHVLWNIPFSLQTDKTPIQWHILKDRESSINITSDISWLKININQSGLYRVNYDEPTWKILIGILVNDHQTFSAVDRAGLMDDIFMLSRAEELPVSFIFDAVKYLNKEKEYAPWKIVLNHFHDLLMFLDDDSQLLLLQQYFSSVLAPILSEFYNWNDEGSNQMIKLRTSLLFFAIENENMDIIQKSTEMFQNWMDKDEPILVNLREIIYISGIKYGSRKQWQFCWNRYKESDNPREKELLLNALGYSRDIWQLKQYLYSTLNKSEISVQNIGLVISSVAANPYGRLITWDFIQEYWDYLNKIFAEENHFIEVILTKTTLYFKTKFRYNQTKNFFDRVRLNTELSKRILENIMWNIKWYRSIKEKFIGHIVKYFS